MCEGKGFISPPPRGPTVWAQEVMSFFSEKSENLYPVRCGADEAAQQILSLNMSVNLSNPENASKVLISGTSKFNLPPSGRTFSFFIFLWGNNTFYASTTPPSPIRDVFLCRTLKVTPRQEWEESESKKQNGLCRFKQEGNTKRRGEEKSITT